MIYLTRMLGEPVLDASGEQIGTISDVAIATGEVFPRVTSLAFKGPDKAPFMLSWRKYGRGDRPVGLRVPHLLPARLPEPRLARSRRRAREGARDRPL